MTAMRAVRFWFDDDASLRSTGARDHLAGYRLANGEGAYVTWHATTSSVAIENDRLGFRHLFYRFENTELTVGHHLDALVRPGEPLNEDALAVFFRSGDFLGDSTAFANIHCLPPNCRLTFDASGLRLEMKQCAASPGEYTGSAERLQKEFEDLFESSIDKLVRHMSGAPFVMPISGGRDSRQILFALYKRNCLPSTCVSVRHQSPLTNEDCRIGALVASHLRLPHMVLRQSKSPVNAEREKNAATSLCALEHAWILPLREYLERSGEQYFFDGIAGDVLAGGSMWLNAHRHGLARQARWEELANDLLPSERYLPAILTKDAYRTFSRQRAIAFLATELRRHEQCANPIGQFQFWNRTRRTIGSSAFGLLADKAVALAPFLDPAIYSLLSTVPAEFFMEHGRKAIRDGAIRRMLPSAAHIPYEMRGGRDNRSTLPQRLKGNGQLVQQVLAKPIPGINRKSLALRALRRITNERMHDSSVQLLRVPIYMDSLNAARA